MTYINDEFKEWANPQLQSRSGFHSFYNGVDDLIERSKDDDNDKAILLGMVCNYLIEVMEVNEDVYELEYDIIELTDKTTNDE
jgi:predicted transcriptional regulator